MAIPWMIALKVIPWGDVIEHAPKVLGAARKLLDRQRAPAAPTPPLAGEVSATPDLKVMQQQLLAARAQLDEQARAQTQLTQTVAELAEQNARLVGAVEVLRARSRLMLWLVALNAVALGWLLLR